MARILADRSPALTESESRLACEGGPSNVPAGAHTSTVL